MAGLGNSLSGLRLRRRHGCLRCRGIGGFARAGAGQGRSGEVWKKTGLAAAQHLSAGTCTGTPRGDALGRLCVCLFRHGARKAWMSLQASWRALGRLFELEVGPGEGRATSFPLPSPELRRREAGRPRRRERDALRGHRRLVPERLRDAVQAGAGPDLSGDAGDEEDGPRPSAGNAKAANGGRSGTIVGLGWFLGWNTHRTSCNC